MRILGPHSAPFATVLGNIPAAAHARFTADICPAVWRAATRYGLDGPGMVAQAGKETAWGNFKGDPPPQPAVMWWFYNTCGLKIREHGRWPETSGDLPFAHQIFPNWDTGATAHAQHLIKYTGGEVPTGDLIVDPRYALVRDKWCENWSDLGGPGRWAPSPTYGVEIETIMRRLQGKP